LLHAPSTQSFSESCTVSARCTTINV
jgi:hypothetical protein